MPLTQYAPIIIFAFNRLNSLKRTVSSLLENEEAKDSDLFIFVDGPRKSKNEEKKQVAAVQDFVKTISGFKSLTFKFAQENKGLAKSIIEGTTDVINEYNQVIVLEDDLVVSKSFLKFMNKMLKLYENDERVMQISGFGCKLTNLKNYPYDIYMNERAHSWSWATWKNRWDSVDWSVEDFETLKKSKKMQKSFNKRGSDLFKMLKGYMTGMNNSWFIRFNYSMFKQKRYSIMPVRSLVRNDGFGEDATNCKNYNRYKIDFESIHKNDFKVPNKIEPCERLIRNSVRYWSIPYRIYGKIMTFLTRFF